MINDITCVEPQLSEKTGASLHKHTHLCTRNSCLAMCVTKSHSKTNMARGSQVGTSTFAINTMWVMGMKITQIDCVVLRLAITLVLPHVSLWSRHKIDPQASINVRLTGVCTNSCNGGVLLKCYHCLKGETKVQITIVSWKWNNVLFIQSCSNTLIGAYMS